MRAALGWLVLAVAGVSVACTPAVPGASSAAGSTPAAGTTTGINDHTILVGISSPESGPGAIAAAYTSGFKTYLAYRSAQGNGINGYKFESQIVDNLGTAAGGAQAMQQILAGSPFMTVITGSSSIQGSVPIIASQGKGVVLLGLGNADILQVSGQPNTYGFFPHYTQECYFMADYAVNQLKAKSIALVYEDSATGQGAALTCPTYALTHGASEFKNFPFPPPAVSTNYTSLVASIKDANPDVALFFGSAAEIASVEKAASAIGVTTRWIGSSPLFDPTFLDLAGSASEGTYFDAFVEPIAASTDEATLFRNEMQKAAPNAINQFAAFGWSLAAVAAQAVDNATAGNKPLTRESFVAAMNDMNSTKPIGLLFTADYRADHYTLAQNMTVYQVKNGQFVKVSDPAPIPHP
jgi:branched-chain amino acid transport system substrate-binding protein